ncbi:MAG: AAA family ATPase [Patescibacteria group bacterium]|nr:AAA family ATPase [Patescibacteria group bacterium]
MEGLRAECEKEKTIEAFARQFLPFGSSQFSQIMAALDDNRDSCYFDNIADRNGKMDELAELLTRIQLLRASSSIADPDTKLVALDQFRAIDRAVQEAKPARGPERLIKYLAPTGGGKTYLAKYLLAQKNNLRVVESRDAWRRSYYTFLSDICRACKVTLAGENRPSAIEDLLIPALCAKEDYQSIVLCIDEGEFFGREALNGLKLLLNKTRVVPVICAIPEAHEKWNRYFPMEADQIARRTRGVFELSVISVNDCAKFFPEKQFKDAKVSISYIAEKASMFGAYSLIRRVFRNLSAVTHAAQDDVEKAVTTALIEMRRQDRVAAKKS